MKIVVTEEMRKAVYKQHGQRIGVAGGKARAKALSPKRRSEIARKAARARWSKKAEAK